MENRIEKLYSLSFILLITIAIEIWFLTSPSIPILSIFGKILGIVAISFYVFGIAKVYFQK
jgi:hypothetical protein